MDIRDIKVSVISRKKARLIFIGDKQRWTGCGHGCIKKNLVLILNQIQNLAMSIRFSYVDSNCVRTLQPDVE